MKVYAAINAVQRALSVTGIAKNRTNTQGSGYKFRGIDDVYQAIAPLLAEHGLCIIPRMVSRSCVERQSKNGGALFYVTVEAEFDFVSAEDGSHHTARTFGEAMDSGDKATNKAMSAAYKYAAFQTFAIPTEGNPDADAETHEVAVIGMSPSNLTDWLTIINECEPDNLEALVRDGLAAATEVKDREAFSAIRAAGKKRNAQLTTPV
jgi:ERF superfamily